MKRSIISLAIVLTLAFLGGRSVAAEPAGAPPKLGNDQNARWVMVYKVDKQKTVWRPEKMDSLVAAISKRVNPGGLKDIVVKSLGDDMVQIIMPSVTGSTAQEKAAKGEGIRKIIRASGALEFRIVATKRDNESLIDRAKEYRKKFPAIPKEPVRVLDAKTGKELAKWCRVRDQEVDKLKSDDAAMMVGKVKDKDVWDVLVLFPESDAYDVTGADLRDARADADQATGLPSVVFSFNSQGAKKFGHLTGEHVPIGDFRYKLAIVLDNELQTAPNLISKITDSGRITGNFTAQEVKQIVAVINAGALPAALEPTPIRDMIIEGPASK